MDWHSADESNSQLQASPATDPGRGADSAGFSFGGLHLEADGTLWRGEAVVHLPPKELAALRLLLANAGKVVSAQQLRQELWGDVHVTADSVPKCLSSLRARLEPDACIQTVYKRGYRFSAPVKRHRTGPGGPIPRLAILPFATGYLVQEHLGAAIAEETVARLSNARFPVLSLLARDSVFALVRRGLTAQQIGKALKADLVLTGTLAGVSTHFRLRAEMIRVEDGTQIWVEDMLVDQSRAAGLESELVERLAFRLGAEVSGDRSSPGWRTAAHGERNSLEGNSAVIPAVISAGRIDRRRASPVRWNNGSLSISAVADGAVKPESETRQKEAYEFYLRGRYDWQTLERHRMQDGLQHLLRASELDPSLIAAKVDVVHLCVAEALYGFMAPGVAAAQARRAAESIPDFAARAEVIVPALGWMSFHLDHDLTEAIRAFRMSEHLPHDPWTTRLRVMLSLSRGRYAEAMDWLHGAMDVDPYSAWLQARLAWTLHLDGQADESEKQILHCIASFPEHESTSLYGAMILAFHGKTEQAIVLAKELAERLPYFDPAAAVHAYALACAGRGDEARAGLERLQWLSRERFVLASFTPAVYVALGDHQSAITELRAAEDSGCPWFFQMLADPRLKPLEGHPEFERMRAVLDSMEARAASDLEMED